MNTRLLVNIGLFAVTLIILRVIAGLILSDFDGEPSDLGWLLLWGLLVTISGAFTWYIRKPGRA